MCDGVVATVAWSGVSEPERREEGIHEKVVAKEWLYMRGWA